MGATTRTCSVCNQTNPDNTVGCFKCDISRVPTPSIHPIHVGSHSRSACLQDVAGQDGDGRGGAGQEYWQSLPSIMVCFFQGAGRQQVDACGSADQADVRRRRRDRWRSSRSGPSHGELVPSQLDLVLCTDAHSFDGHLAARVTRTRGVAESFSFSASRLFSILVLYPAAVAGTAETAVATGENRVWILVVVVLRSEVITRPLFSDV